jgi:hypothetical protein
MPEEGESDMGLFAMTRETFELDLQDYARDVPAGSGTGERNFLPFVPWLAQRSPSRLPVHGSDGGGRHQYARRAAAGRSVAPSRA